MSDQVDELTTLRHTVAELTQKNAARKQRIAELEGQLATAQIATQTAEVALHELEVSRPMQTLAEVISPTPELFLAELSRVGYKVTKADGKLTLMDGDKPVEGVDLTLDALRARLLDGNEKHRNFAHLITRTKASGGGAIGSPKSGSSSATVQTDAPKPKLSFGLR
ncbi:MAG: hypothetical protein V4555_04315 [Acidobacteriota bacterium]